MHVCLISLNYKQCRKTYMKHLCTNIPSKTKIKNHIYYGAVSPEKLLLLIFKLMFCKNVYRYFYPIPEKELFFLSIETRE